MVYDLDGSIGYREIKTSANQHFVGQHATRSFIKRHVSNASGGLFSGYETS